MSPAPQRREIYVSRLYDQSRNVLFRAWTEPKHLSRWWGPKDFTAPVCEIQPRVGGTLQIVMRAPDGTDYPMRGVYTEFRGPEALAFDFEALDQHGKPALQGQLSVTFVDEGGKT
ncbi:MAG TPA: SRPBCC domain-containing protein, partial [Gammaproteobacteria bacterium]